jgi:flagellar assembly protein FliH
MSTLIKARSVRYLTGANESALVDRTAPEIPDARDAELRTLKAQLSQSMQACAELEHAAASEAAAAFERGLSEGFAKGQTQTVQDHETRDASLRAGIETAVIAFQASLVAIESLAGEIALASLERLFGNATPHDSFVARTVAHHIAQLATGSVIALDVSKDDFPTDEALAQAAATFPVEARINAQLKAGQCLIRLNLGTLDASLDTQVGRIRAALREAGA